MSAWAKAVLGSVLMGAATWVGVEAARKFQERYATGAELRMRQLASEIAHARAVDRKVHQLAPWVLWEAFEACEQAAGATDHRGDE